MASPNVAKQKGGSASRHKLMTSIRSMGGTMGGTTRGRAKTLGTMGGKGKAKTLPIGHMGGKAKTLPASLVDHNNGTYSVDYQVKGPGYYHISVTLHGNHVQGSPYTFQIADPTKLRLPSAEQCRATGPGLMPPKDSTGLDDTGGPGQEHRVVPSSSSSREGSSTPSRGGPSSPRGGLGLSTGLGRGTFTVVTKDSQGLALNTGGHAGSVAVTVRYVPGSDVSQEQLVVNAKRVLAKLSPWFGFEISEVKSRKTGDLHLEILTLIPGGPAEETGLRVGDTVFQLRGQGTKTKKVFGKLAKACKVGDPVKITVTRSNRQRAYEVVVGCKNMAPETIRDILRVASGRLRKTDYVLSELQQTETDKVAQELLAQIEDNADGTYGVSFPRPGTGTYTIEVTLAGTAVPGSPFKVVIPSKRR